ncbi:MAG: hypothetical protein HKM89_01890 [Gemmatimonadales bacterium]|nr:hypothetical protein [Gemmatimonadales bacterium]
MWGSNEGLTGLALIAVTTACSANPAPSGWLGPAPVAVSDPYGAWVQMELTSAGKQVPSGGELIAVALDSVFVLTPDGEFHAVARADVTRAKVAYYDSQYGTLAAWTTFGSLGTLSHGFLLVFSLPVWTIGGWAATAGQSRAPLAEVSEHERSWDDVAMYARFPQGLPDELDRRRLRPKPTR